MPEPEGPKRAQEATLSARPSDPRLREAQRLHHEERQFQRQADEATQQHGQAASEAKDLTIAKAAREAEIDQLNKAIDDTRQKLFQAHDRVKAMELEAISVERSDPGNAADIREAAAAIRADIPELEKFAGTHEAKRQEAWDQVKDMEVRLEARTADVAKHSAESERLRNLAQERESAAEALEQQRAAEPVRADVPEVEIFEPDRLRTALRDGHRVVLGEDGHIRVFEERGRPMTDEQIDYLESKLPELRHRLGEGWHFTIETDGTIGGNGPWGAHYFASSSGQISEQAMAEVRAAVGQGQDVSIAPDGTVVTSEPATAVSADQARQNLDAFNREVESGALTERMASGQGYDLNPDGTGGYSAIAPMTAPTSLDPAAEPSGSTPASEQNPPDAPGVEPATPSGPAGSSNQPAPASDEAKALEDRARALRDDLAEARDRRIDVEDRIYATHRAAELAESGAVSEEAEAKTLRAASKKMLDEAARYDKEADEADAAGKAAEAQELREKVSAAMSAAKANSEIASRRTESAERYRADVAKNEAENQALSKQRTELTSTLKKSEVAIDAVETKASILRQSDTVRTAAEGLERSALSERASGNEPGAAAMEASARDMRAQAGVLRANADAVQVDEVTLKALEDLGRPHVDQRDPMPPEEPPAGTTETSTAPATDDGTPEAGREVAAAQPDQDPTGEGDVDGMAGSELDGPDGAGVSADTTATDHVELFGQESQVAETQETLTGADAGLPTEGSDTGSYDPYEDQTFATPEPVPTYADTQNTESYEPDPEDTTV